MIKHPRKQYQALASVGHRFFVYASIGFTVLSTAFIGMRFYAHFQDRKIKRHFSDSTWKILRLNHIALATQKTEDAASFYADKFHLKASEKMPQPEHGVNTVFVDVGNTKLELLDQLGDKSPIKAFLGKNPGGGVHHLCFEVDNIEAAVADLRGQGVRLLGDIKIGAHGKPVIFIHPKDCYGVLIELEQA